MYRINLWLVLALCCTFTLQAEDVVKRYISVSADTYVDSGGKVHDGGITYDRYFEDEGQKAAVQENLSRSNGTRSLRYTCIGGKDDGIKDKTQTFLYTMNNIQDNPQDLYQGFSMYIPGDFKNPDASFFIFWENKQEGTAKENPVINLMMNKDNMFLQVRHSSDSTPLVGTTPSKTMTMAAINDFKGHWVDFVVHTRFPYADGGIVEVWMKKATEDHYRKVCDYSGPTGYWNYKSQYKLKFGVYRGSTAQEHTLYFDEVRLATSFDAARPDQHSEVQPPPSEPSNDPVIADTWQDSNVPMNVIDGDRATRWSAEGSGRWLRWDLGSNQAVGSVLVSWFRGDQRRSRFALELSADGSIWRRTFDGESSGQTLLAEAYPGDGGSARYVRLVGYGNSDNAWNSVTELAIETGSTPGSTSGWEALPLRADTYARDGAYRDDSFGQEAALIIKQGNTSYTRETYLRFDASQALVAGEAELALRVAGRGSDAGSTGFVIELMQPPATPWQEDSLSWNQRPTTVLQVGASFTCPAQVGEELVIDVSDLLQAAADAGILDRITLRIRSTQSGSQRYVAFESDEAVGGTAPQLRWRALVSNG